MDDGCEQNEDGVFMLPLHIVPKVLPNSLFEEHPNRKSSHTSDPAKTSINMTPHKYNATDHPSISMDESNETEKLYSH